MTTVPNFAARNGVTIRNSARLMVVRTSEHSTATRQER
jgi:hypothetical protein